jgi:hypothetical protein
MVAGGATLKPRKIIEGSNQERLVKISCFLQKVPSSRTGICDRTQWERNNGGKMLDSGVASCSSWRLAGSSLLSSL